MRVTVRTTQLAIRDQQTGFVTFQPDFNSSSEGAGAGGPPFNSLYPFGFRARPRDPSTNASGITLACGALVVEDGDEGHMLPTEDPRYQASVRDEGYGGSTLFGVRDDGTTVQVSQLRILGDDVSGETAGGVKIEVPYPGGTHIIEVDLGAGKIRLVHGEGPSLEISATGVVITSPKAELGAPGGPPIVVETGALAAAFASLAGVLANLGVTWTPPTNFTATKATAT